MSDFSSSFGHIAHAQGTTPSTRAQREAEISDFLKALLEKVKECSPKWTLSEDVLPYGFEAAENYAREHFPSGCSQDEFCDELIVHTCSGLSSSNYPHQAHTAWRMGVLAHVLSEAGQENVILQKAVPKIWEKLAKRNPFVIGHFLNPCVLDVMRPGDARDGFKRQVVDLLRNSKYDSMEICGFANLLCSHVGIGSHLGQYNLEDEKTELAEALVDTMGIEDFVTWSRHGENIKLKISSLVHILDRLPSGKAKAVSEEIARQVDAPVMARNITEIFEQDVSKAGSFPLSALKFFQQFMKGLSAEQRHEYGGALIGAFGSAGLVQAVERNIKWIGGFENDMLREFIDAFELDHAKAIVSVLTKTALDRNYAVPAQEYHKNVDLHWNQSKFAISLHDIIPERLRMEYEKCIIDFLDRPDRPDFALVTAANLLRGSFTQDKQGHYTQEVDFYPSVACGISASLGHIKPRVGQNSLGMVVADFFVGTMSEYFDVLSNPPQGGGRYYPPNGKPMNYSERYMAFYPQMEAAEGRAIQGHPDQLAQPTLLEFLRARQPGSIRALE